MEKGYAGKERILGTYHAVENGCFRLWAKLCSLMYRGRKGRGRKGREEKR